MASEELKPCPFCGGKADPVRHAGRPAATPVCFYIECLTCRAASGWVKNLSEAAAEWNRRAQDFDAMRQRTETVEALLQEVRQRCSLPDWARSRIDAALAQQVKP